jgi:hypothetical protein
MMFAYNGKIMICQDNIIILPFREICDPVQPRKFGISL